MAEKKSRSDYQGIIQMAYTVANIHEAIGRWVKDLKVGPFFLLDHFQGVDPVYRGAPSKADVAIAMGYCGDMQIELIQPNDHHPSVYREAIEARGYGFHHFGMASHAFDADVRAKQAEGFTLAFKAGVPTGGSVGYMQGIGLPGFLEFIEVTEGMCETFGRFHRASVGWDGRDPVRSFL